MVARRSGLGKGLGALIPTRGVLPVPRHRCCGRCRSARSSPTRTSPESLFDEEALVSLTASVRELGVLQPVLVRPLGRRAVRADRRRAALASGQAGRPARPSRRSSARSRTRLARAGAGREPAPRGPQPARGGGGLPAAHRGLRPHPRRAGSPGRQEPLGGHATPCGCSSSRRRSRSWWPRASSPPATPGPCSGTPDRAFQEALARRAVAEDLSVREVEEAVRANARSRGRRRRRARRARQQSPATARPGLLELEELLSSRSGHQRHGHDGAKRGKVVIDFAIARGPRADLPRDGRSDEPAS